MSSSAAGRVLTLVNIRNRRYRSKHLGGSGNRIEMSGIATDSRTHGTAVSRPSERFFSAGWTSCQRQFHARSAAELQREHK